VRDEDDECAEDEDRADDGDRDAAASVAEVEDPRAAGDRRRL
jgi:hypothetical protein